MASCQFFGVQQVISAAGNLKCPAWAIFIGRQLFCKYEGTDEHESLDLLQQNLETLEQGQTTAIYTLKFFEVEEGKKIKINERTVCDGGSFNFKLVDPEQRMERYGAVAINGSNQMISEMRKEMQELRQMISQQRENEYDESEPETIGSVLIDAIKNPDQLFNLINAGRALFGLPVQNPPAVAIGGIGDAAGSKEDQLQRLSNAIDILEKNDPKIVDHLEKLAEIATKNPMQFKMLLTMLDAK